MVGPESEVKVRRSARRRTSLRDAERWQLGYELYRAKRMTIRGDSKYVIR